MGRLVLGGAVSTLALLTSIGAASAQQLTVWQGTINSDWSEAGNWSGGVPGAGGTAIDGGIASEIVMSGDSATVDFMYFGPAGFRFELNASDLTVNYNFLVDTLDLIDSDLITGSLRAVTLNLSGASTVDAASIDFDIRDSDSVAIVDGPNAQLTAGELIFEAQDTAFTHTFTARNGATVESGEAFVGFTYSLEGVARSDVTMNVSGAGTTWANAGVLYLGGNNRRI